jgi:hypothetical protein
MLSNDDEQHIHREQREKTRDGYVTELSKKSLHTFVLRVGTTESPMQERPVHHMLIHHEHFGSKQKDTTALLGDSSCLHPII